MPIALDPSQTFEIAVKSDEALPIDERPVFVYRFAAGRELRRMREIYEKVMKAGDDTEMPFATMDELFDRLRERLIGWRNMIDPATGEHIDFDPAELDRLITLPEAFELLARVCTQGPDREEKKRLESLSECSTEKSAATAPDTEVANNHPTETAPSTANAPSAAGPTIEPTPETDAPVAAD